MKRLIFPVSALAATPAYAEVCDKYSESWRREHGPLDAWTLANSTTLISVSVTLALAVLLFRSRSLASLAAVIFAALLLVSLFFVLFPESPADNRVLAGAIREGCMSGGRGNDLIGIFIYGLLVAAFIGVRSIVRSRAA